jgi:uncharacterized protein YjbI with pentapeptide repeats
MADQKSVNLAITISKFLREMLELQRDYQKDQSVEQSSLSKSVDTIRNLMDDYANYNFQGPLKSDKARAYSQHLEALRNAIKGLGQLTLEDRDFSGSDLRGVVLCGMRMKGCDFRGADLMGANLSGADLTKTNFSLLDPEDDLSGADVRDAVLDGVRLDDAILDQANFSSSSLRGARLRRSSLFHTLFIHADLSKAVLEGAQLGWANMRDADLSGATFGWISAFEDEEGIKRQLLDLRVNIDGARFSRVDT